MKLIKDALNSYEQRCGDNIAANMLAKICLVAGTALFAEAMATNATTKEGLVPFSIMAGGLILDKVTKRED